MRLIQSFIIRAIVAIVIGALLVKYRVETMTWITIAAGILFFISGAISCTAYYFEKEKAAKVPPITDEKGDIVKANPPIFPIVGIGCAVLGIILTLMPNEFITWVVYIFAAILILGAVNQFMNLASSRQFARVPLLFLAFPISNFGYWYLYHCATNGRCCLASEVIGWCLMFYGVVELVNAIKINQMKRAYEKDREC